MTRKRELSSTTAPKIINLKILTWFLGGLVIITLGLSLTQFTLVESARMVFGSVFVLFIPGYFLSFVFFKEEIDWLERVGISIMLSISIPSLVIAYTNLSFNSFINTITLFFLYLFIILFSIIISSSKKQDIA